MKNIVVSTELEALLRTNLKAIWNTPGAGKLIPPLMIWGPPGIGKSSIVEWITQEFEIGFVDVRLAQREPVDVRGLPVPTDDGVKWITAKEWPRDPKSRGIIMFDELTAADRTLQVAAYEFILDRRLGTEYSVPDGWYIVAAGNRTEDSAVATTISSALANRFLHVELQADLDSWTQWATRNGVHPMVIGYVRFQSNNLFNMEKDVDLERGWPSPRSWERVSHYMHMPESNDVRVRQIIVGGLVGVGVAASFEGFLESAGSLADVHDMMIGKTKIRIPSKPDAKYALTASMAHILLQKRSDKKLPIYMDGFFDISIKLSSDFAAMALQDVICGLEDSERESFLLKVVEHPKYDNEWRKKHGSAFQSTFTFGKKEDA